MSEPPNRSMKYHTAASIISGGAVFFGMPIVIQNFPPQTLVMPGGGCRRLSAVLHDAVASSTLYA